MRSLFLVLPLLLVFSPAARAATVDDVLKEIFDLVGAKRTAYGAPLKGRARDGRACQVYVDSRPNQPYFSASVGVARTEPADARYYDSVQVSVVPTPETKGWHYSVDRLTTGEGVLAVRLTEHIPAGKTDFGWPTPPWRVRHTLELRYDGNKELTQVTIGEAGVFPFNLLHRSVTQTCSLER